MSHEIDERWFRGVDEEERDYLEEVPFVDIDRDGDYFAALETEVVELRKDRDRLDKLDKHRIAASHGDPNTGDEVLDYYYWELRCQCYDIRNAIDNGEING